MKLRAFVLVVFGCAMVAPVAVARPRKPPVVPDMPIDRSAEPDPWAHDEIQLTLEPRPKRPTGFYVSDPPEARAAEPPTTARPSFVGFGLGPTYFHMPGTRGQRPVNHMGLALALHWRVPLRERFGVDLGATWGFTRFDRTLALARGASRIAEGTVDIVGREFRRIGEDDDDGPGYAVARSILLAIFLVLGLLVSAVGFVISPFASTTYMEADATASYDFGSGREGIVVKGGTAFAMFVDPRSSQAFAGVGPKLGLAYRSGRVELGVGATYLPPQAGKNDGAVMGLTTVGFVY